MVVRLSVDVAVTEQKYRAVADELRDNILAGRYAPGEAFPSVKMLCRRFGISHLTAAKVIGTLKGMGLVKTRNGVGTFVARRMKFIGLIVPMLRHVEIFPPIIRELSRLAQSEGVGVDFVDMFEDPFGEVDASVVDTARRMAESGLSGVIFHPVDFGCKAASINEEVKGIFEKAGVPLVLLDADSSAPDGCPNLDFVGVDNRAIGEAVGRHVIKQGAKSVAFVTRSESGNVRLRLDGLLSAISHKRGVRFAGRHLWQGDNDLAALERKWNARLPDAIVCSSDHMAANVLKLLKKIGKRCPQDVLVAGVNDVDLATLVTPPLTTIHQPCRAIAKTVFETLLWRMANPDAETRRILVAANLVVRESTMR